LTSLTSLKHLNAKAFAVVKAVEVAEAVEIFEAVKVA